MKKVTILVTIVMLMLGLCACQNKMTINKVTLQSNGDSIKAHIAFLANDKLKGRLPGTPEYQHAEDYVVRYFTSIGLSPGGENRSFKQQIQFRKGIIDDKNSSMAIGSLLLVSGEDYQFLADLNSSSSEFSGEMVFAGYGIEAQQLNHDDYYLNDVENKTVLVFNGAPKSFPPVEFAHYGNLATKFDLAISKGARGLLVIQPNEVFKQSVERNHKSGNVGVISPEGTVFGRTVFNPNLKFVAFINEHSLKKTLGFNLEELWGNYREGAELHITIKGKTVTLYKEFQSANVIGKLIGSDSILKEEYVVHTAHLDHLGIGTPVNGDSIYNGAHDNASGVASMLEIARLYTMVHPAPKRSVLFCAFTAEEMGLLGSDYFTRFPTVNAANIVANLNTDMPTFIAPLLSVEPLGAEHSSLMNNVRNAADYMNIEIMFDHIPERVRFVRSDQYNFIRRGIPAIHIKYGLKSLDSLQDLRSKFDAFDANVYHKPSDELWNDFDFQAAVDYVKLTLLIGFDIAQQEKRPSLNDYSFFKKTD